jgi:HD-GYP domain-containing protein (c-di-GMP phosphodiesterase class II)
MSEHNTIDVSVECLLAHAGEQDHEDWHHCRRVEMLCAMTAKALGWEPSEIPDLRLAALLHHMDRSRIPESALAPGVAVYLRQLSGNENSAAESEQLGDDRSAQGAAIISLVDRFDRLVTDRRYRGPISDTTAIEVIRHDADTALEESVLEAFCRVYEGRQCVWRAKAA